MRARVRESPASRPPSRSHAPSFLFPLSAAASSPSLSAAPFARLDLTLLFPSRTLVLLLLRVPPRPPPPSILIDRSCTRARSASPYHLVSSPSTRSRASLSPPFSAPSSSSSLFLSACSPSAASSFFVPYSTLSLPDPPWTCRSPLTVLLPCSCAQRGINYSKNLYCYYYRLTIPSQLSSQRRALESSTMRDSVRALPTTSTRRQRGRRRRRRVVDVWCHSGSPRRETRIDFTRVTFFFSLARAKKEDELRRRGHHVSTRLICMNTDERISRERILDRDVRVLKEHIGVFF